MRLFLIIFLYIHPIFSQPQLLNPYETINKWELVVIYYDSKQKEEKAVAYYLDSYSEMWTKLKFIANTHRPKGSIKRLLYREILPNPEMYPVYNVYVVTSR